MQFTGLAQKLHKTDNNSNKGHNRQTKKITIFFIMNEKYASRISRKFSMEVGGNGRGGGNTPVSLPNFNMKEGELQDIHI